MIRELVLNEWVNQVRQELDQRAHDAMEVPKSEPFEHGIVVGEYRGLSEALRIMDEVINNLDK